MSVKNQITTKLMEVYEPAEVRAGQVVAKSTNFDGVLYATGWWFIPFQGPPLWLGKSLSSALEIIDQIADSREF